MTDDIKIQTKENENDIKTQNFFVILNEFTEGNSKINLNTLVTLFVYNKKEIEYQYTKFSLKKQIDILLKLSVYYKNANFNMIKTIYDFFISEIYKSIERIETDNKDIDTMLLMVKDLEKDIEGLNNIYNQDIRNIKNILKQKVQILFSNIEEIKKIKYLSNAINSKTINIRNAYDFPYGILHNYYPYVVSLENTNWKNILNYVFSKMCVSSNAKLILANANIYGGKVKNLDENSIKEQIKQKYNIQNPKKITENQIETLWQKYVLENKVSGYNIYQLFSYHKKIEYNLAVTQGIETAYNKIISENSHIKEGLLKTDLHFLKYIPDDRLIFKEKGNQTISYIVTQIKNKFVRENIDSEIKSLENDIKTRIYSAYILLDIFNKFQKDFIEILIERSIKFWDISQNFILRSNIHQLNKLYLSYKNVCYLDIIQYLNNTQYELSSDLKFQLQTYKFSNENLNTIYNFYKSKSLKNYAIIENELDNVGSMWKFTQKQLIQKLEELFKLQDGNNINNIRKNLESDILLFIYLEKKYDDKEYNHDDVVTETKDKSRNDVIRKNESINSSIKYIKENEKDFYPIIVDFISKNYIQKKDIFEDENIYNYTNEVIQNINVILQNLVTDSEEAKQFLNVSIKDITLLMDDKQNKKSSFSNEIIEFKEDSKIYDISFQIDSVEFININHFLITKLISYLNKISLKTANELISSSDKEKLKYHNNLNIVLENSRQIVNTYLKNAYEKYLLIAITEKFKRNDMCETLLSTGYSKLLFFDDYKDFHSKQEIQSGETITSKILTICRNNLKKQFQPSNFIFFKQISQSLYKDEFLKNWANRKLLDMCNLVNAFKIFIENRNKETKYVQVIDMNFAKFILNNIYGCCIFELPEIKINQLYNNISEDFSFFFASICKGNEYIPKEDFNKRKLLESESIDKLTLSLEGGIELVKQNEENIFQNNAFLIKQKESYLKNAMSKYPNIKEFYIEECVKKFEKKLNNEDNLLQTLYRDKDIKLLSNNIMEIFKQIYFPVMFLNDITIKDIKNDEINKYREFLEKNILDINLYITNYKNFLNKISSIEGKDYLLNDRKKSLINNYFNISKQLSLFAKKLNRNNLYNSRNVSKQKLIYKSTFKLSDNEKNELIKYKTNIYEKIKNKMYEIHVEKKSEGKKNKQKKKKEEEEEISEDIEKGLKNFTLYETRLLQLTKSFDNIKKSIDENTYNFEPDDIDFLVGIKKLSLQNFNSLLFNLIDSSKFIGYLKSCRFTLLSLRKNPLHTIDDYIMLKDKLRDDLFKDFKIDISEFTLSIIYFIVQFSRLIDAINKYKIYLETFEKPLTQQDIQKMVDNEYTEVKNKWIQERLNEYEIELFKSFHEKKYINIKQEENPNVRRELEAMIKVHENNLRELEIQQFQDIENHKKSIKNIQLLYWRNLMGLVDNIFGGKVYFKTSDFKNIISKTENILLYFNKCDKLFPVEENPENNKKNCIYFALINILTGIQKIKYLYCDSPLSINDIDFAVDILMGEFGKYGLSKKRIIKNSQKNIERHIQEYDIDQEDIEPNIEDDEEQEDIEPNIEDLEEDLEDQEDIEPNIQEDDMFNFRFTEEKNNNQIQDRIRNDLSNINKISFNDDPEKIFIDDNILEYFNKQLNQLLNMENDFVLKKSIIFSSYNKQ